MIRAIASTLAELACIGAFITFIVVVGIAMGAV